MTKTINQSIFLNTEQYLNFRAAWSAAVNSPKAKSHLEEHNAYWKNETGMHKVSGWINAEHHILYNLLCNKPHDHGFTITTNSRKLMNGTLINHGYYWGMLSLKSHIRDAKLICKKTKNNEEIPEHISRWVYDFLKPFANTVTIKMLSNVILPGIEPIYCEPSNVSFWRENKPNTLSFGSFTFISTKLKEIYREYSRN